MNAVLGKYCHWRLLICLNSSLVFFATTSLKISYSTNEFSFVPFKPGWWARSGFYFASFVYCSGVFSLFFCFALAYPVLFTVCRRSLLFLFVLSMCDVVSMHTKFTRFQLFIGLIVLVILLYARGSNGSCTERSKWEADYRKSPEMQNIWCDSPSIESRRWITSNRSITYWVTRINEPLNISIAIYFGASNLLINI